MPAAPSPVGERDPHVSAAADHAALTVFNRVRTRVGLPNLARLPSTVGMHRDPVLAVLTMTVFAEDEALSEQWLDALFALDSSLLYVDHDRARHDDGAFMDLWRDTYARALRCAHLINGGLGPHLALTYAQWLFQVRWWMMPTALWERWHTPLQDLSRGLPGAHAPGGGDLARCVACAINTGQVPGTVHVTSGVTPWLVGAWWVRTGLNHMPGEAFRVAMEAGLSISDAAAAWSEHTSGDILRAAPTAPAALGGGGGQDGITVDVTEAHQSAVRSFADRLALVQVLTGDGR